MKITKRNRDLMTSMETYTKTEGKYTKQINLKTFRDNLLLFTICLLNKLKWKLEEINKR